MGETLMKKFAMIVTIIFLLGLSLGPRVEAADDAPANPYSGELLTRSTLSGDWGGLRNQLAEKGVTFDLSITQVGQGVVNGGTSGAWQYGGRGDIVMNVDSGKLGLWPGGFLNLEAEGNWASSVNFSTGAISPVNTNQLFPVPIGDNFNLPALNFTQFLSPHFGLTLGKYATLTETNGDMNEFAHGKGSTQFMNTALNANAPILFTVPYSALGIGVIGLPTKDPNEAIVSFMVLQANGQANKSGFTDLDGNKLDFAGEGRVRTDFFGFTGHQVFGAMFSNKKFFSVDQRLGDVIESQSLVGKKGSWNIHYNFDQYFYEPKKGSGQGLGVFGRFGASDGNPNFMHFFYSLGVGGKGMFSRPNDQFGLGFYYIDMNNPTIQGPLRSEKLLRDEYGFEAYYNFAITPWLMLTPDLQVVRGAQKDQHTISSGPLGVLSRIDKQSIGTSTVLGLRLKVVF
jgi:porin